jgi:hypothetical protein
MGWLVNVTWKRNGRTLVTAWPDLRYYPHEENHENLSERMVSVLQYKSNTFQTQNSSTNQWTMMLKTLHSTKFESTSLQDTSSVVGNTLWDHFSLLIFLKVPANQCILPNGRYHETTDRQTGHQLHTNSICDRQGRQLNGTSDAIKASAGCIPYVQWDHVLTKQQATV